MESQMRSRASQALARTLSWRRSRSAAHSSQTEGFTTVSVSEDLLPSHTLNAWRAARLVSPAQTGFFPGQPWLRRLRALRRALFQLKISK